MMSESDQTVLSDEDPQQPSPGMRGRGLWRWIPHLVLVVLLLATLVGGVWAFANREPSDTAGGGLSVADQQAIDSAVQHRAVELEGRLLDGGAWSSSAGRGSVLVVNLWASWCGPCRAEQPSLSEVANGYRDKGVRFIGVNYQDNEASAKAYAHEFQIPYPSLLDPSGQIAAKLQAVALPTTFILDRDEVVAYRLTGKTTVPILSSRLDALLAKGGRWS